MKFLDEFLDKDTSAYLGVAQTLGRFSPVSEAGKRQLRRLEVFVPGDEAELIEHHRRLKIALDLIEFNDEVYHRLRHLLREIPRIDEVWEQPWGQAEFALLTSFRYRHHQIRREIANTPELSSWLDLVAASELDQGLLGEPEGSRFYLADNRSQDLADVRRQIAEAQYWAENEENEIRLRLAKTYGLPQGAEQWVVDREDGELVRKLLSDTAVVLAAETVSSLRFAPKPSERLMDLRARLSALLQRERQIEASLYQGMEDRLREKETLWDAEAKKLVRLDMLLAMAEQSRTWKAVAPILSDPNVTLLEVEEGRHEPVREAVMAGGGEYVPLELHLASPVAILTGTNMGGKTVALQTAGWLQVIAQLGFLVPAKRFTTRLYSQVNASSTQPGRLGGLSEFGGEVERLARLLSLRHQGAMLLIDEPGRATHVKEGRALTQSVLDSLASSPSLSLVATHFDGLGGGGIAHFRMAGLKRDQVALWEKGRLDRRSPLHRLMDYRVLPVQEGAKVQSDALQVAELLGLETAVVERARELLKSKRG